LLPTDLTTATHFLAPQEHLWVSANYEKVALVRLAAHWANSPIYKSIK